MRLHTFVHISDLHIGQPDEDSHGARVEFWQRWPLFTGVLGHSAESLSDLDSFFAQFSQDERAHLVVTGDLTATGHPAEFDAANQYLGGVLRSGLGYHVGLEVYDWLERAIPGNHDHWAGYPIPIGPPTAAFQKLFPNFPSPGPTFLLRPGLQVRLLRINTDADVHPFSPARFRAIGRFANQLKELQSMLDVIGSNAEEIRVLCLHHSQSHRGPILEIEEASRKELDKFIVRNRVSVLLCGHIHRPPRIGPLTYGGPGPNQATVLEARCGTTTQIDPTVSRRKEFDTGKVDASWENSLLVHRILERGSEIHWETELFLEGRSGFVPSHALRRDLPALTQWKVWPWPPNPVKTGSYEA